MGYTLFRKNYHLKLDTVKLKNLSVQNFIVFSLLVTLLFLKQTILCEILFDGKLRSNIEKNVSIHFKSQAPDTVLDNIKLIGPIIRILFFKISNEWMCCLLVLVLSKVFTFQN